MKTLFKDEKALVAALIDMGFAKDDIHMSKKPVRLDGSPKSAHIVIRKGSIQARKTFGHAYTDLGFEMVGDTFKAHIDDYTFSRTWQNGLQQRYDYRLQTERARLMGYQLTETKLKDGSIKVIARR